MRERERERASERSEVERCGASERVDERCGVNEQANEWPIFHSAVSDRSVPLCIVHTTALFCTLHEERFLLNQNRKRMMYRRQDVSVKETDVRCHPKVNVMRIRGWKRTKGINGGDDTKNRPVIE